MSAAVIFWMFWSAIWTGAMAGYTFCDGSLARRMLLGAAFGAWHGLLIFAGMSLANWVAS